MAAGKGSVAKRVSTKTPFRTKRGVPTVLFWSGGKDSMMAFDALNSSSHSEQDERSFEVTTLLTTIDENARVGAHGVPLELIEQQAGALGCTLRTAVVPQGTPNTVYEARVLRALGRLKAEGIGAAAAGDLFLDELRAYRQRLVEEAGLRAIFPLWQRDALELARAFIGRGFSAVTVRVDAQVLPERFVGRDFDQAFLAELPAEVDPCGENGEFHTFVSAGPHFKRPVTYRKGDVWKRSGRLRAGLESPFYACELLSV